MNEAIEIIGKNGDWVEIRDHANREHPEIREGLFAIITGNRLRICERVKNNTEDFTRYFNRDRFLKNHREYDPNKSSQKTAFFDLP